MEKFNVLGFGHVGLSVRDVEVSRKFYEDMLGFSVVWEHFNEDGSRSLLFMGNQSCVIEFLDAKHDRVDGLNGPINHLSILVDDIEAAVAELKSKGIVFELDITLDPNLYQNGEKFAIFRGPDGERLQLEQIL
ncbi:VOC family protein [Lederbergia panacisoli]|uniref:VOC family protein n=1 Tax=Lederbergia panacisoli TaxID=1255251 RepID=UPI00214B3CA2|nr:VOC family protein [Lederbergia panacisoli]MCR2823058.1 VOC family protein [Lederbergia panacisoli]